MIKHLLIFLFIVGLFSCTSKSSNDQEKTDTLSAQHEEHPEAGAPLQLDQNNKWKADSVTMINVGLLKKDFSSALDKKSKDFPAVADQLQADLNKLVSECKMTGADHEALHKWLEPLIEGVKKLKEATADNGSSLMKDISNQLNLFDNYFEQ